MRQMNEQVYNITIALLILGGVVALATSEEASAASKCTFNQQDDRIVLGNSLCQIVWNKTDRGWSAQYQSKVNGQWQTVAYDDIDTDVAYGLQFPGEFKSHAFRYGPYKVQGALPSSAPEVIEKSNDIIHIKWKFDITDENDNPWPVQSDFTIRSGDYHVYEETRFHAPIKTMVRYQRGWQARDLTDTFLETLINCVTHNGWQTKDGGSFLAIAHQGPEGWTLKSGGGGFVRIDSGFKRNPENGYFTITDENAYYNIFHRIPHMLDSVGWVNTWDVPDYTLKTNLIMYPGSLYKRDAVDYMYKIQPLEKLKPRYSWKSFTDKLVEGFKADHGLYEDHGDWGIYHVGYMGLHPNPWMEPHMQKRDALDWGGGFDVWTAYMLHEYGKKFDDQWAIDRAKALRKGIVADNWQIDIEGEPCEGAFWMWKPKDNEEYMKLKKTSKPSEKLEIYGDVFRTPDLWICDSGKIGYWLCELYEQTGEKVLLEKAKYASEFLLKLQTDDGNLTAGRVHISGQVVYPANLASNSCAIMLWARLYEITKDEKYKEAALKCAKYSMDNWLNGEVWKMYGGEWDVPGNMSTSTGDYVAWAYSILYRATDYKPALDAIRRSSDWLLTLQALFDTNLNYYNKKMYWKGTDCRMTGGVVQGLMNEGYGYLLWHRPEVSYAKYLAWKATGDEAYLESAKAYIRWETYFQHDYPSDPRVHGAAREGIEWASEHLNGIGLAYLGESTGDAIIIMKLMEEGITE